MGSHTVFSHIAEAIRVLHETLTQCFTISKSAATGAAAFRLGGTDAEGWELRVHEEDVVIPSAVASVDLSANVPAGAAILAAQANLETAVTATTAVKVGIGIAADPDKYGLTSGLTKNLKISTIPAFAVLGGAYDLMVYAWGGAGAAAGTINSGTVRVRIVYAALSNLADAA